MTADISTADDPLMTADRESGPLVVVIGGGLTGLAAAHRLVELRQQSGRPLRIQLIEAGLRFGGIVGSETIAGHRVDLGADSFITNKPAAIRLCERLGLADQLTALPEQHRGALILYRGRPVAVPDGFQLMTPSAAWPVLLSPLLSTPGKLRMAMELFVPRKTDDRDESLADFVRRRFGREALERLVQPLVGGIYTSDPENLSLKAALPRFVEQEKKSRSLILGGLWESWFGSQRAEKNAEASGSGARYGLFAGFSNGMQVLVDRLVSQLTQQPDVTLTLNTPVKGIHRSGVNYQVEFSSGERLTCAAVIVTPPAWKSADLVREVNPSLAAELAGIDSASSAIVVSGHREVDIGQPLNAFGLVIPAIERRRILAVSFAHRKFPNRAPAGSAQLRTFVGGALQPELLELSDAAIIDVVREELTDILRMEWRPDFIRVVRYPRAMPQLHVGHAARLLRIQHAQATTPELLIAGNAYEGVGVPDAIASGEQAAQAVARQLSVG